MNRAIRWTVLAIALFFLAACEDKACAKMKKNPPKQFMKEIEVSPGQSRTVSVAEVFSDLPAACIERVTKEGPENDEIKAEIKGKELVVSAEPLNREDCIDPNAGPSSQKDGSVSLKVKTKCDTTVSADLKVRVRAPKKLCAQARGLRDQMAQTPPQGPRGMHIPPGGIPIGPDFGRSAHSF